MHFFAEIVCFLNTKNKRHETNYASNFGLKRTDNIMNLLGQMRT